MKIQNINNVSFGKRDKMMTRVKEELTKGDNFILKQYYESIKDIKPLSRSEEKNLARQIREGGDTADKAKEKLIKSLLPIIVYYAIQLNNGRTELADLIQEGNRAVIEFINKKTYNGETSFKNFVFFCLFRQITGVLKYKSRLVKLPEKCEESILKLKKTEEQLAIKLKRPATDREIAKVMKISCEKVKMLKMLNQKSETLTDDMVDELSMEEYKKSDRLSFPAQRNLDYEQLQADLKKHFSFIRPAKQKVLIKRFGLFGTNPQRAVEIAEEKGITEARVNMIINEVIDSLWRTRYKAKRPKLIDYVQ